MTISKVFAQGQMNGPIESHESRSVTVCQSSSVLVLTFVGCASWRDFDSRRRSFYSCSDVVRAYSTFRVSYARVACFPAWDPWCFLSITYKCHRAWLKSRWHFVLNKRTWILSLRLCAGVVWISGKGKCASSQVCCNEYSYKRGIVKLKTRESKHEGQ